MRSRISADPSGDAIGSSQLAWHAGLERRRSPRASLHWRLYLSCAEAHIAFRTVSQDISRYGFYCLLNQAIAPGAQIQCDFAVPTHRSQDPDDIVYLRCSAEAVRLERFHAGAEFGLACRVEDYCVIHSQNGSRMERGKDMVQMARRELSYVRRDTSVL